MLDGGNFRSEEIPAQFKRAREKLPRLLVTQLPPLDYVNPATDFSKPVNTITWFSASDGFVSEDYKFAAKLLRLD